MTSAVPWPGGKGRGWKSMRACAGTCRQARVWQSTPLPMEALCRGDSTREREHTQGCENPAVPQGRASRRFLFISIIWVPH